MLILDFSEFQETMTHFAKREFSDEQIGKACARTLNHLAKKIQSNASRDIRKVYKIKHKDLGNFHKLVPATPSKMQAKILADMNTLGMGNFNVSEVSYAKSKAIDFRVFKNKKVSIKRGPTKYAKAARVEILVGKKVTIMGTWTRKFDKSGKTGVFARGRYLKNGGGFEWGKDPNVWRSLKTKSPFFALHNEKVYSKLATISNQAFYNRFEHELTKGLKYAK